MTENEFISQVTATLSGLCTRLNNARVSLVGPLSGDDVPAQIQELLDVSDAINMVSDVLIQAHSAALLTEVCNGK